MVSGMHWTRGYDNEWCRNLDPQLEEDDRMTEAINLSDIVHSGGKGIGKLRLSDRIDGSPLETPVLVVHGREPGPQLWLTAAIHGDEYEGIQAVLSLYEELDPNRMHGALVGIPVSNPLAYAGLARETPEDGVNLNRVFPGRPDGTVTYRMAHRLFKTVNASADYHIDLHSGGISLYLYPYAIYYADGPAGIQCRDLALAAGPDLITVRHGDDGKGSLYAELARAGVASIIVECGGAGIVKAEYAERHKNGVLNAMRWLGMIDGSFVKTLGQRVIGKGKDLYAPVGGFTIFTIRAGDSVQEGQVIGRILGIDAARKHTLLAPCNGVVTWYRSIPAVSPGELLASIRPVVEVLEGASGSAA
jgi:predicted deacylase